jgi:uncharacterized phiE125 gp8 family phage protein
MMTRTEIDRDALPEALLSTAKTHMRVEFTRDDEYITLCLKRAIDFFERTTGMNVFSAEYDWYPQVGRASGGEYFYALPFQPQPSFTVTDDTATDISDQFAIRAFGVPDEYGPRTFVSLNGAIDPALVVKIKVGFEDEEDLPPGILSFVLEAASWFYEYREAGPMPGADGVPYLNQLLTAYWVPRV